MIAPRIQDHRPLATILIGLVILCWATLIAWGQSPYSRFMHHGSLEELGGGIGPEYLVFASAFVAAWFLMTVAMMLPTALPLVLLFGGFTSRRRDAVLLTPLLIAGYCLVWVAFGALAHMGDLVVHTAVARSAWLEDHAWILAAGVVLVAGIYQFTPLKTFCLTQCRSPYQFILGHWHGKTPRLDAFHLGMHHGVFCVGCCWSLMLLMFAVGAGNLAWMLGLGVIMAVEKNLPWGRRLSAPLGVALLAVGIALVLGNVGLGSACAHDGRACAGTRPLI
jgi:predicted metal-binding membrane protein